MISITKKSGRLVVDCECCQSADGEVAVLSEAKQDYLFCGSCYDVVSESAYMEDLGVREWWENNDVF